MGLFDNENDLNEAANKLLNPRQEEPKEPDGAESPEEESVEEETVAELDEEVEQEETSDTDEEEDVDEEEEEPSEEGDEDEEDEEPQEVVFTVKVDGEEIEVNQEELISGYQRNKDYTQKTQSLAEERKAIEATQSELEAQRTQYIELNKQMLQQDMAALKQFDNIDWASLKENDPLEYAAKYAEKLEAERQAQMRLQATQNAIAQSQQQEQAVMNQYLAEQQVELETILPESKDAEFKTQLAEYAQSIGYTDEDLSNLVRAKDVVMLNKARLYDELQGKREKISKKKGTAKATKRVKATTPAKKQTKKARAVKEKRNQLRTTGGVKDAQAALIAMMSNPTRRDGLTKGG